MKEKSDLTRGWLRKAMSDLVAMKASAMAGARDAACFHAQQCVEKCLKAYLIHSGVDFPLSHNLAKLLDLAAQQDASFSALHAIVDPLTPYAVELRYDEDFWPSPEDVECASEAADNVRSFVFERLPTDADGVDDSWFGREMFDDAGDEEEGGPDGISTSS